MSSSSPPANDIPGPRSRALAQELRAVESPNVTYIDDDFPIFWESAIGTRVLDADGNSYLDFTSAFGVASIGHSHPAVVEAIRSQAGKLIHGMGDVHPSSVKVALCRRIADVVPISDSRIILSQNGSDAVESALKTTILATGKPGILAFNDGYHGLSYGALETTFRADFRAPFLRQLGGFAEHVPYGFDMSLIDSRLRVGQIGAVLVEPIQGRGGIVTPPPGWLNELRETCTRLGVLLIFDEIFTGWGRTGDLFACEHEGFAPDILCIGKAMGGGLPISACVAGADIMANWGPSDGEALHTSTFLGNPLACAAALAAIDVITGDRLWLRARDMGAHLTHKLEALKAEFPEHAADIRGRGLMIGFELANKDFSLRLVKTALKKGLIVLPAGDGRVIELIPPLTVSEEEIDEAVNILRVTLKELVQ